MALPTGWKRLSLSEVCETKPLTNPRKVSSTEFNYVDISSVSNKTFSIGDTKRVLGSDAPSRARKPIFEGDVIFATTRPYLKTVALVPASLHGQICSTGFCVLRPSARILSEWVFYNAISNDFVRQIVPKMRGANYPAVTDGDVLDAQVPLPPIEEQSRIIARIVDILGRVDELESLSREVPAEVTELKRSLVLAGSGPRRKPVLLSELVDWVRDTELVKPKHDYTFAGIKSFGKGLFVRGTVNSGGFAYKSLRRLKCGDFIFPKLMAWEGAFAMVTEKYDGMVVSPEFVVFRPKTSRICSEVLDTYFRSPVCLEDVGKASTGSNRRRRRLNPKPFLTLSIPVPSEDEQRRLKAVYKLELEAEAAWQNRSHEIAALRDSILRKAFAGEL